MRSETSNKAIMARRKPKVKHFYPEAIHRPCYKELKENISDRFWFYVFALLSAQRYSYEKDCDLGERYQAFCSTLQRAMRCPSPQSKRGYLRV